MTEVEIKDRQVNPNQKRKYKLIKVQKQPNTISKSMLINKLIFKISTLNLKNNWKFTGIKRKCKQKSNKKNVKKEKSSKRKEPLITKSSK